MYELNKARLIGIGPRGARYSDVTLDLSDAGEAVTARTLTDAPTHRPAPYSLLMLENGGGKSVLLKLLFSVVLPGRKKTLGGASLEDFVLETDTGHVALEWMHTKTGQRLVTAKTYQRRTRTASSTNPLAEAWYSFQPTDTLSIENLPVADDGRRRRVEGYREALEAANRATPAAQLAWLGDDQGRWRDHLRERGIEPDLFDIQRRMNGDEGDAAAIAQFTSSKAFVDWLLTTVTDGADYTALAGTFEEYATTLAARESLLLEKDFLEGAVVGLGDVADEHANLATARNQARAALRHSAELLGQLQERRTHEDSEVERLGDNLTTLGDIAGRALSERDRARDVTNEVRRQTITLRRKDAEAKLEEATAALTSAEAEVEAWRVVPLVAEHQQHVAQARELANAVKEADESARPALDRRDEAAADLLAALDAAAQQRTTAASQAQARADAHTEALRVLRTEQSAHSQAHGRAEQSLTNITTQVAQALEAIAAAVGRGYIAAGTAPESVADAAEAAETELERAKTEVSAATKELATARVEHKRLVGEANEAQKAAGRAGRAVEEARNAVADLDAATTTVATLALVSATSGDPEHPMSAAELDTHHDEVWRQLTAQQDGAQSTVNALTREQEENERTLDALGNGGLLPPREHVEQAVKVLAAGGIHAHPGWRYLNEAAPATQRLELARAYPHLADGVVLVNAAQLASARDLLEAANLLPAAAVTVSAGQHLLTPPADQPTFFTIEPSPAMYDEVAAASRREQLERTMEGRAQLLAQAKEHLADVAQALGTLSAWRLRFPAGLPGELAQVVQRAVAAELTATQAAEDKNREADLAAATVDSADDGRGRAADLERAAHEKVVDLRALVRVVAPALGSVAQIEALQEEISGHRRFLEDAAGREAELDAARESAGRDVTEANGDARAFAREATEVLSTDGRRAQTAPDRALTVLRQEHAAAQLIYEQAATSAELKDAYDKAAARVRASSGQLSMREPAAVTRAQEFLTASGSSDSAVWDTQLDKARQAGEAARQRERDLGKRVGKLESEEQANTPSDRRVWVVLTTEQTPISVEHGERLLSDASKSQTQAQADLEEATRAVTSARQLWEGARGDASAFHGVYDRLASFLRQHDIETPTAPRQYPGNPRVADTDTSDATEAVVTATKRADATAARFDTAVTELRSFVGRTEYDQLTNVTRRAMLDTPVAMLGTRAREWAEAMEARQVSLTTDLEKASAHRANITRRMASLVTDALTTLRNAQRLSRLPDTLGDWSGKDFLRIRYKQPDAQTVSLRVGDVVDRVSQRIANAAPSGRGSGTKFSGLNLILEAVHECVPAGFSVDILKPDSVLRDERVAVEDMNDVLSGGQALTSAIVLYCTLAALKANQRGQMRSRHSGVLFLDNPIGKASAAYLLDVQKGMADALGVQLVYTTGLYDDRVLASFPLWVRLRNDADLRAGLKHISVSDRVAQHLPEPYDAGAADTTMPGTVTASRVYRRPSPEPAA